MSGVCASMDTLPSAQDQRRIIACLEDHEESVHVYYVSKEWYNTWQEFVETEATPDCAATKGDTTKPSPPRRLTMDREDENNNMLVDEKIWKTWVEWYGVADSHQLDRRNWASDDKDFEICVLSPYSGIVEHPTKTFDISEKTGYIELQLRRIFRLPEHRNTRLWACERKRHARFRLLRNRDKEICMHDGIDQNQDYILAVEMANQDGSWPSSVPGEPLGSLDKYKSLACGPKPADFWENELATVMETLFQGIQTELKETVEGVVKTTRCIADETTRDALSVKTKLTEKMRAFDESTEELERRKKQLEKKEAEIKAASEVTVAERKEIENERRKLEEEKKLVEEFNRTRDTRIKLDVGGHFYTTSTLTLIKDSGSMLAAMFSGRHSLKREQDGSYFIDRDGTHFRYILNYLRDGGFKDDILPVGDRTLLNELLVEAEYYQIAGLIEMLRQLLDDNSGEELTGAANRALFIQKKLQRKIAKK